MYVFCSIKRIRCMPEGVLMGPGESNISRQDTVGLAFVVHTRKGQHKVLALITLVEHSTGMRPGAFCARCPSRRFGLRRHREVAKEVLEASKTAADDAQKQFAISFFDNKFNSLVPLKVTYFLL